MIETKNVFITGGGGCVGRALIPRFLDNHWAVTALVHPQETGCFPFPVNDQLRVMVADLGSLKAEMIVSGSTVIHLAAKVHSIPKSEKDCQEFFRVNRDGTVHLAEAAIQRNARSFIFVSTSAVYGDALYDGPCTESTDPLPRTPYAVSKYEAELRLNSLFGTDYPLIVFRPSIIFGPGDRGNFLKLFRLAKYGFVPLIAGGEARKNILYVDDLAETLYVSATDPELFRKRLYNVAYEHPYTFRELVKAIEDVSQRKIYTLSIPLRLLYGPAMCGDLLGKICRREMPVSLRKIHVMLHDSVMDVSQLHTTLNQHRSFSSFEQGLARYIDSGESPWPMF